MKRCSPGKRKEKLEFKLTILSRYDRSLKQTVVKPPFWKIYHYDSEFCSSVLQQQFEFVLCLKIDWKKSYHRFMRRDKPWNSWRNCIWIRHSVLICNQQGKAKITDKMILQKKTKVQQNKTKQTVCLWRPILEQIQANKKIFDELNKSLGT